MLKLMNAKTIVKGSAPVLLALGLAACGGEAEEPTYEVDATDESGGDLMVNDENMDGVEVDLPETEMENVEPGMADDTAMPAEEDPATDPMMEDGM